MVTKRITFIWLALLHCAASLPAPAGEPKSSNQSPTTPPVTARPTLFLIGDSTVNTPTKGVQGWGTPIAAYFDPAKIKVENRARGGRSSRTYFTEGLWEEVRTALKPGDV